ncbi:MAG: futalosine nucleosidase, partial [Paenibacillus sp.]|nr:futalosine nucleosidase [Paenibacillus sp.]
MSSNELNLSAASARDAAIDGNVHAFSERSLAVLVVTAVDAERDAVLRGIADAAIASCVRFDVIAAGVGPAYAAASTAAALARGEYDLVVSAGIGGGFPGVAEIGSLVVADEIVAADLGAETADGQLTLDELGFGTSRAPVDAEWSARFYAALASAGLDTSCGPILTVSLATGRAETMELRRSLVPGAAAEGMEGYGVAVAAAGFGIACAELRAISNAVGPRDRSTWRIGDALRALENAFRAIAISCQDRTASSMKRQ